MAYVDRSGRRTVIGGSLIALLLCCGAAGCFRTEHEASDGDDESVTDPQHRRDGGGGDVGGGGTGDEEGLCGNGRIETGESCDGTELGGANCVALGFSGGSLFCDPVACTFDDSMCLNGGPGMGGSGGDF